MPLLRSERFPAVLLLLAAAAGLIVANSPAGAAVDQFAQTSLGIPGILEMTVSHWISDALLAVFFFAAAIELQYELTQGQLNSPRKALQPVIAAAGGVLVPIAVYLVIAGGGDTANGWPIPTATDIAFALGVLAVFGRGLPSALRVFLLALAILDDIVGIIFIAVLFTTDLNIVMLLAGLVSLVLFAWVSRRPRGAWRAPLLIILALTTWYFVHEAGVHATIAGVALGLLMHQGRAARVRHGLEPWVNGLILPIFAFSAALVAIPQVEASELSPALWGVLVALPVGKIIGITLAGWVAVRVGTRGEKPVLGFWDIMAGGALGGIGFTVSLLLSDLAFAGEPEIRDQAVLGVLGGSAIALVLSGVLVSWRAAHHRRLARSAAGARGAQERQQ